jgi:amino acid transporter
MVLMIINSIIGAGIFGLPSRVYALIGVYSIAAFFVCAAIVLIFILCFAEVGSRFRTTGGPYTYVGAAFGQTPAFMVGWLLLFSRVFNYATLINLLVTYAAVFYPLFTDTMPRMIVITAITAILAYSNHIGVKSTTRISNLLTIAKLVPLALFIIAGFFFADTNLYRLGEPPAFSSFTGAILLLVFAFGGFESVMVNTGEIREPTKTIPFGLLAGTTTVALFYILIQIISIGTLPSLATSEKPLADAAISFIGPAGGKAIAAGALVSIIGTLNVLLLSGSRLPYAFSTAGQFPKSFSRVHPSYLTPTWSLLTVAVLCIATSIMWSFLTALTFAVIIRVAIYLSVCASLLRLRKSGAGDPAYYRVKGGNFLAVAGIILSMWLLSNAGLEELRNVAILLVVGLVIYGVQKWYSRGQTPGH